MRRTAQFLIFLVFAALIIWVASRLYYDNTATTQNISPNITLTHWNYVVQIVYNVSYLLVAIIVLAVANSQLNKTRDATSIQALNAILDNLKGARGVEKRRNLAKFILAQGEGEKAIAKIKDRLEELSAKAELSDKEDLEIAYVKNVCEAVIYEFEILSFYYKRGIYNLNDIYELFSYEIQRYWLLMEKLGFIKYIRENVRDGEHDFYNKFEWLFNHTLKKEIIVGADCKAVSWVYYQSGLYLIGDWLISFFGCKSGLCSLRERKERTVAQFLLEEVGLE